MYSLTKKLASGYLSVFLITPAYGGQKPFIEAKQVEAIYDNLVKTHWVPETGLFISFAETQDRKLVQQASTYDQAAVGILAVRLGDIERAKGIFHFFRSTWLEGPLKAGREGVSGLANFYNAEFGGEGIEKTIHMGPNAWAGLFAAILGNSAHDEEATEWALKVAKWAARDLSHRDGGVAMGPMHGSNDVPWPKIYSTENNLSYYALLAELLRAQDIETTELQWIETEKNQVENWLVTVAFDKLAYTMNRGVNPDGVDRTRALDTLTWLISAVGPARLYERGVDPDRLMRQAEESFEVTVKGGAGVDPADQPEADLTFALASEETPAGGTAPRSADDGHRMIWYEGLGQYINALTTMAQYNEQAGLPEKALAYMEKARHLTEQFDQAALKNYPARTAYAYATEGKFFHDGWYPPKNAADGPPSSLISAVWRCFAGLGIDPLAGKDIAGVPPVMISTPKIDRLTRVRPSVLYGASDDMAIQAWQYLNQGDTDRAIQQAQATIAEWSAWALKLQDKKALKVGQLVEYSGLPEQRKQIFSYWALNDVAAAYFILGKSFDQKRHYAQAAAAFQQIVRNYPLSQIWDPRGWFWSPVQSIGDEFVSQDPRHYGDILPQMLAASPSEGYQPF